MQKRKFKYYLNNKVALRSFAFKAYLRKTYLLFKTDFKSQGCDKKKRALRQSLHSFLGQLILHNLQNMKEFSWPCLGHNGPKAPFSANSGARSRLFIQIFIFLTLWRRRQTKVKDS